ncbi:MAG: xanthine dehydrogenase family protein molybdopterin-binding subunit [Alphaproteobacteria bacterium]|nr:xanthine dehydrogenase family protein molybdopterin-binding subunit [Alphaproteobacteria bacterium]
MTTDNEGLIGKRVSRPNAKRLVAGRGRYADDLQLPRMVHAAFLRSPHPHARIVSIDTDAAKRLHGVVYVMTGRELAEICTPWQGGAAHIPSLRGHDQYPMAVDVARWQGEPVAVAVATSRAVAEDAAELIAVDWEPLPTVSAGRDALSDATAAIHPGDADNLAFEARAGDGDVSAAAEIEVSADFAFGRHTGVPLEARAAVADWNPGDESLTVYASHQTPWQQQDVYSRHLGIDEHRVRVICPDVGGGFGIKLHVYGDEVVVAALSPRRLRDREGWPDGAEIHNGRRDRRHRPLFGLSPRLHRRRHDEHEPHRRAICARGICGALPSGVPEPAHGCHVSRRRPADRDGGDGAACRSGGGGGGYGPGRIPAQQLSPRRGFSDPDPVRRAAAKTVAHGMPRPAPGDDGLRCPARGTVGASRSQCLARDRAGDFRRTDRRRGRILRPGAGTRIDPGRRDRQAGAVRQGTDRHQRDRSGAGDIHGHHPDRR